ncbi:MAG: EpsI family protein, partial [Candidatus Hydrogenedentes bacterium]|nr:EpsI family protein [Candidatus Hydrogenedentota bacterium]
AFLLILGDFLGFRVFAHISLVPMLAGLVIVFAGTAFARRIWFALAFLIFMIPIPPSLTQSIALQLKLIAAECAVRAANLVTLPMVREGSYIYFGTDRLLVGDVCGGLRSLIALLAIGAVAAYISPAKTWARVMILLLAGPIAVVANIARIFLLCVVGYFYGSEVAGGWVHDYSGFLIYAIAIALFTAIDIPLRRWAGPAAEQVTSPGEQTPLGRRVSLRAGLMAATVVLLISVAAGHVRIVDAQSRANMDATAPIVLNIPSVIVDYTQAGDDYPVDERTREVLETSAILMREYRAPGGRRLLLSIVHAGSTRRSLHFPEVCLVGDGWEIVKQQEMPVGILFSAKQLVLVKGNSSEAVLYWFKTGDYVTGNYFDNAYQWAKNQITFGEPTSSMIKLTTPIGAAGERAAFASLEDFAAKFAPVMYRSIE